VIAFSVFYKLEKTAGLRAVNSEKWSIRPNLSKEISELWFPVPLEGLYENLFSVKSKSFPITFAHNFLCARNPRRGIHVAER
jgi:hypothetical protein